MEDNDDFIFESRGKITPFPEGERTIASAEIIKNRQGKFITAYFPSINGSYEQSINDISNARESDLLSERDYNKVKYILETKKMAYEDKRIPLTIRQAMNLAKRVFFDEEETR